MSTELPLTLHQSNDEIINLTITTTDLNQDLSTVTQLRFYLKPDPCTADTDSSVTILTSSVPAQVTITAQSATQILATVYIPASVLVDPYSRWWRIDAYVGTTKRTAQYGPVAVIDL